jgi:phage/plasmid-associated DNA primase
MSDPRETAFELYDRLGFAWSSCDLRWNETLQQKEGLQQIPSQKNKSASGIILYAKDKFSAIDVDKKTAFTTAMEELMAPVCTMIQKTNKGHHYVFAHNPTLINAQKGDFDIRTKGGVLYAEPSKYRIKSRLVKYKWIRVPRDGEGLVPIPEEVLKMMRERGGCFEAEASPRVVETTLPPAVNTLVVNDEPEETAMELESVVIQPRRTIETPFEELTLLCECLGADWLANFGNWFKLGMCLKAVKDDARHKELFLRISRKAPRYDTPAYIADNSKRWDKFEPNGRIRIDSLNYWARCENKVQYFQIKKARYWDLIHTSNKNSLCEMFYTEMEGEVMYSKESDNYYIWNAGRERWLVSDNKAYINSLFLETITRATQRLASDIPPGDAEDEVRKGKLKAVLKFNRFADGSTTVAVNQFLPSLYMGDPTVKDPNDVFNKNPDLLPLENGVWVFSEHRLRPYEREDYLTKRIPIRYEEGADTTDIELAMKQYFKTEEVIRFVRYYIGYIMTGYTTRQDFLCVWGTTASNGKSFLFGDLVMAMMGGTGESGYAQTLNMETFRADKTESNPEIYKADGNRYGLLDDPSETVKISQGTFKLLTGAGQTPYTVRTLHKCPKTFIMLLRLILLCNTLPNFKLEDEGMLRRINVLEMRVSFCRPDKWAGLTEEQKASGDFLPIDDAFTERLSANKVGLLKYFLGGASDYIRNPRLEAPEPMRMAKKKASAVLDATGAWIRGNLKKMEKVPANRKKSVSYQQMKEAWKEQNIEFVGMRTHGFKTSFLTQLATLGYEVDEGTPGKSRERVLYCEMIPDREEGEDSDGEVPNPSIIRHV